MCYIIISSILNKLLLLFFRKIFITFPIILTLFIFFFFSTILISYLVLFCFLFFSFSERFLCLSHDIFGGSFFVFFLYLFVIFIHRKKNIYKKFFIIFLLYALKINYCMSHANYLSYVSYMNYISHM